MKLVIFGLTISSSWGNGHATIWRGLCNALARAGHDVVFFEQDVSYYATHRDLQHGSTYDLVLYANWDLIRQRAWEEVASADSAIVTSYCPDAVPRSEEHTSELQSRRDLVCRLLLEKKNRIDDGTDVRPERRVSRV